jgi:2,3-diaminopropionate biosynthesis protein SbnA
MRQQLKSIERFIGRTPLRELSHPALNLFSKLEYHNFSGSIKDRSALSIIRAGIERGEIGEDTVVVESSSGNFAVALAHICLELGIPFIPVIDPNINSTYENLLRVLCKKVIKVTEPDPTGGYLLTRLTKVKEILNDHAHSFWPNQYSNPGNPLAYRELANEVICEFDRLDYVFVAVSTGGTLAGVGERLKERFHGVQVVAVDVEGSVVFGQKPQKRYISGIGSSKTSEFLNLDFIDHIIHVSQEDVVEGCYEMLERHKILAGASTGAVLNAMNIFFDTHPPLRNETALFFTVDRGTNYIDTIYNPEWVTSLKSKLRLSPAMA